MAEHVKRRIASARLAVAFVVAGSIAGAAWAQGSAPSPVAHDSAVDAFLKLNSIKSENIIDGSLLFKDFKKFEVPSYKSFHKGEVQDRHFKKATNTNLSSIKGELGDIKLNVDTIKGELVSGYLKTTDADARYLKLDSSVVHGDGSVFTGDGIVANQLIGLLDVPNLLSVQGVSQKVRFTNTSSGDLQHTACMNPTGEPPEIPAGTLKPGGFVECATDGTTQSIQFFTGGVRPSVATVSFSGLPAAGGTQDIVQILIGL